MARTFQISIAMLVVAGLWSCAVTRVDWSHPLVSSDAQSARVYFIRPFTERYMDIADNTISVEADRAELLRLAKGEYTLVHMRPGTVFLGARSRTTWGPTETHYNVNTRAHKIKDMTHSQPFAFEPGETYFVVFTPVDGEFRGIYYEMVAVDLARARELSAHLGTTGVSRSERIDNL
jgi:hypothetical protein